MQRIHAKDTVPVLPEGPKDGTPGYFSDGNAATGDMATVIDAAWCNGVQEELMAFLTAAGVEPSAEDLGQVLASVKKLTDEAVKKYAAPIGHASKETTYGLGDTDNYGHLKLSDAVDASTLDKSMGTAATPKAVAEAMTEARGAAEAASHAQATADAARITADAAGVAARDATASVNQLEQNVSGQIESLVASNYWQTVNEAVDADNKFGIVGRYYLTEQASGSTHMPAGIAYPAFFLSGSTPDRAVALQLVLSGSEVYIRQAITEDDGATWQGTAWYNFSPPSTTTPKPAGTASPGREEAYARGDHVHPAQTSVSGNAGTATKLATARTLALSGDVTGSTSFDGTANRTIAATLASSGVTAGSYGPESDANLSFGGSVTVPQVTVDAKGRVTEAAGRAIKLPASPTSVSGNAGTATKLATARTIRTNLGSTSAASFDGSANVTPGVTGVLPVANGGTGNTAGNAVSATKATQDGSGNVIVETYATKEELANIEGQLEGATVLPSATTPKVAGTAAVGSEARYARGDHVHPAQTSVSGNAGTATKLATARTIDGVDFNGSAAITHYGTCSTAAATAAKTVALTGFKLVTGAVVFVRFTVTNTAANPTLNINSTGAKAIQYRNASISAGYLAANRTYAFVYDGSSYELVGDVDTNTTYAAATAAPKVAGTAAVGTSARYARES